MLIKLFFAEFSRMKYMKWGGLYLLALYDGIYLYRTLKINAQKTNQEPQLFLPLIRLKELLPQDLANWHTTT